MAVFTGPRIKANNVFGTLTDNPLLIGATTMNSAGLANLPAVASAHAVLILDPLRTAGAPEIVIVTAHTGAATSATITRAAYGSSARQHLSGVLWVHAETVDDLIRICTSGTRPADVYEGELIYETDTDTFKGHNGTAWEDILTLGAWASYTPTLTQSGAVTKTVTYAKYTKVGRVCSFAVDLAATGAGTGANNVVVGLPLTAAAAALLCGVGQIYDTSAGTLYNGNLSIASTTTVQIFPTGDGAATYLGVRGFTAALAAGDLIRVAGTYETAT